MTPWRKARVMEACEGTRRTMQAKVNGGDAGCGPHVTNSPSCSGLIRLRFAAAFRRACLCAAEPLLLAPHRPGNRRSPLHQPLCRSEHVSNVLAKLGVANWRVAAIAALHGLT